MERPKNIIPTRPCRPTWNGSGSSGHNGPLFPSPGRAVGLRMIPMARDLRLRNHLASAAFFEAAHDDEENDDAVLAVSQTAEGHFLLGEAARNTANLGKTSTGEGQAAIARLSQRYLPMLRDVR
ncbi:MAG: hypothetical protein J5I90_00595, partial [Caldilineales bacterium]|nr:hypothetical protein [Caldilineales bacterium]